MRTLKPFPDIALNTTHPLARNLIGCWLMNEGAGRKIYDSGPNRNAGSLQGNTCFTPARFGTGLLFNGSSGYVTIGGAKGTRATISLWCKSINDASVKGLYGYSGSSGGNRLDLDIRGTTVYWTGIYNWSYKWEIPATLDPTQWCHICVQCGLGGAKLYVNGRLAGTDSDEYCFDSWTANVHRIGWDFFGAADRYFNGIIDHVLMYNRTLTAGEVAQLYCEPLAMFRGSARCRFIVAGGTTYQALVGTIAAASNLSARARTCRRVTGIAAGTASLVSVVRTVRRVQGTCTASSACFASLGLAGVVNLAGQVQAATELRASLSIERERQMSETDTETRTPWLRDALFNGLTSNAFQLGTVLTRGWFWTRRTGCSEIYRGRSLVDVDFTNSVCVVEADARTATIPATVRHRPGLSYCYVVRRFNTCGSMERTTSAAVRLCLDSDGNRRQPAPNPIHALNARILLGNHVGLSWLYSPLGQETPPDAFYVFSDGKTVPLAVVPYEGPKLYWRQTGPLPEGEHVFIVQSQGLSRAVIIQVAQTTCQTIQIVGVL